MTATAQHVPFSDPHYTADGKARAFVDLQDIRTLWINTGTLCNLACANCYIESSPSNDRLVYISAAEVAGVINEAKALQYSLQTVGITGGEPFMNPEIIAILAASLSRGIETLVLTNAMRPLAKRQAELLSLQQQFGNLLRMRVSIDHYDRRQHELERGPRSWRPTINGLAWLNEHGFRIEIAGRTCWQESETQLRDGFAALFSTLGLTIDAYNPVDLVLFPEMSDSGKTPEITTDCWRILNISPDSLMCADTRMIVKHKHSNKLGVIACTLLPYEDEFDLGDSLTAAARRVYLNHRYCSAFCVLSGGRCSQ